MSNWKYTDASNRVATRTFEDGRSESCLVEALPEGTIVDPAESVQEIQARIWRGIKALRDDRISNGGAQVGGHWYHSDTHSKLQQLTMSNKGVPAGTLWKTMSGDFVAMDQALIDQVVSAQMTQEHAIFVKAEQHRAAVNVLTDTAAIEAYDWQAGWPDVYQASAQ